MSRIQNFEDWVGEFEKWQSDIGFPKELLGDFHFETKFGDLERPDIEFGEFKGAPKWERRLEIPNQQIRDALLNLIVYQGDTEFASVEQQRLLVKTAPTEYDEKSILRIMSEEMRHGWQMCHLMVEHFGETGRVEAQKQLERRSWNNERLLGSFNVDIKHWLDFYTFTQFVDRDGKFQLKMLSYSAFAPLAQSMGPMLKEESFHLGTGHTGLKRVLRASKIPLGIVQRYVNKWVPTAYDLFGGERSTNARMFYTWGLKGRFNEHEAPPEPDLDRLNEYNRNLYYEECQGLIDNLNGVLNGGGERLFLPSFKFRRSVGEYKEQCFDLQGNPMDPAKYEAWLPTVLPTPEDEQVLTRVFAENDWVASKAA